MGRFRTKEALTGIAFLVFALAYLALGFRLKLGTVGIPGPGFLPLVIGAALAACSLCFLFRTARSARPSRVKAPGAPGNARAAVYGIPACTLAYPFGLDTFGFLAATTGAALAMLLLLQPRRFAWALATAALTAVIGFLVFPVALGVSFPFGHADEWLYRLVRG